ncbi:MAG TPA: PQQ-binding-like beta-propeller repeat protein [Gammaproteobacteria bacterium]|nr:PQQ-binding-like beta-propeller repeat protein [Gammaproteobacteria bacterium]
MASRIRITAAAGACAAALILAGSALAAGGGMGPPEWTQYRMGPTSNAVYRDPGTQAHAALPHMTYHTDAQLRATPVIVDGRLYIGNHKSGELNAFDLASGQRLWRARAPNWVHSEMIYVDGRIYVGYGDREFMTNTLRGEGPSGVLCLDAKTGKILWQFETVGEVMPTPAYRNGVVYITTGAGELYALDAKTGKRRWQLPLRTDLIKVDTGVLKLDSGLPAFVSMSSPHIKNGVLYIGALDTVFAVDLAKRKVKWKYAELASFTDVPPAISADNVIVMTGVKQPIQLSVAEIRKHGNDQPNYHFIYAFDTDGKLRWKHLLGPGPHQEDNTSGAPAIADGVVYVGSPYARALFAYDVDSGKKLWGFDTGTKIKGAPAIADGVVFFGDTEGTLYALSAKTGKLIHKVKFNGALSPAGPVIIDASLFVACQDGNVYSVPVKDLVR